MKLLKQLSGQNLHDHIVQFILEFEPFLNQID